MLAASQPGGSNSLRGGKKRFGPKTKCGNWVELNKEPGQALPPGFPHAMFTTDAQQQMLEGVLHRPKRFGAALPPPAEPFIDYSRVMNYDKRQGSSRWAGITRTEFVAPNSGIPRDKEFASSFKMAGGIADPEELRRYRDEWTVEVDAVRPIRFKTDGVTSANTGVPKQFRLGETRQLPGKPKAIERLLAKTLEDRGATGVVELRHALQRHCLDEALTLAPRVLMNALEGMGIIFSGEDARKVIQFCARGGETNATIPAICHALSGPMSKHQHETIAESFRVLDQNGTGILRMEDFEERRLRDDADDSGGDDAGCSGADQDARKAGARDVLFKHWSLYQILSAPDASPITAAEVGLKVTSME